MRTLSLLLFTAAVCSAAVTPPDQLTVPAGFKVELLREAGPGEGSWICMTQDDKGRLYIASQNGSFAKDGAWGGIWRVTFADVTTKGAKDTKESGVSGQESGVGKSATGVQPGEILNPKSEIINFTRVPLPISDAMGMLWAFDSLYVSGNGPQGRGIYRCKSSKGDGNLDTTTLFKAIPGGAGEHGAHAIVLGPDKKLYVINGNSTGILDGLAPDSPYRNWGEDDLLPRLKDPVATFFDKIKAPYGCVYRTDADGTKWELFAGGFRNPYDIAFNPDGELFTYDSDMEWDRGLPWYRPTRILHVVPGGEYGFREGSAKWPAYFPDSLPAVADIGVGCPTGIAFYPGSPDVGTDAKVWPEKYRRALFMHDWTYGRILAVTLHEKGASYTARNDLASYTYPRDAEANGDVEVFLSGKGMPVTDLEFLRDGSMVFTVGGRGTASALYRVSRVGQNHGARPMPGSKIATHEQVEAALSHAKKTFGSDPAYKPSFIKAIRAAGADDFAVDRAQLLLHSPDWRRLDYASHVAQEVVELIEDAANSEPESEEALQKRETLAWRRGRVASIDVPYSRLLDRKWVLGSSGDEPPDTPRAYTWLFSSHAPGMYFRFATIPCPANPSHAIRENVSRASSNGEWSKHSGVSDFGRILSLLGIIRSCDARFQTECLQALEKFPFTAEWMDDELKLDKLRALELSFARQGRPSEERVKAVIEELLAHYPVPPFPANAATPARNPAAGAPVDAPAWRQNRELCALLVWLSNPELGELNADLTKKTAIQPENGANQKSLIDDHKPLIGDQKLLIDDHKLLIGDQKPLLDDQKASSDERKLVVRDHKPLIGDLTPSIGDQKASSHERKPSADERKPHDHGQKGADLPSEAPVEGKMVENGRKTAISDNSGLGPVPNPGADIFPGRKGAAFHAELGRQVIEKTLALMDAAPSQEEQVWYALCLRWAHGWTPEQRVRYFRWFHEKASHYTGGNSFTKFVEAIRADAASRVPESERAALAEWMHPVATPRPAVLKPRDFVKAWTLPEIESALDKLKDRKPDLARGKDLYTQAQCAQCHLFRDAGGNVGPDLTAVAQRFGRHDILESITDPSKVIGDQYAMITLTILDGKGGTSELSGLVKEESSATITILTDPLAGKTANLYKNVIVKREKSAVSIMPPGLLYTLTAEEVADLIGFLGAK